MPKFPVRNSQDCSRCDLRTYGIESRNELSRTGRAARDLHRVELDHRVAVLVANIAREDFTAVPAFAEPGPCKYATF
jgi:hypothetical protein